MKAASGGKVPPEILSTHPSNEHIINDLEAYVPTSQQRASEINGQ